MKKLISIGVALALLAMVVMPGAVAAQITPDTYAKIPFAIIGSGIELIGNVVAAIPMIADALPFPLQDVTDLVAPWTAGPLAWTVDMLAWALALGADIWAIADPLFEIDMPEIGDLLDVMAQGFLWCYNVTCVNVPLDP